jgi:nucleoside-diphosphate-sugar epimerase
MRVFVTGASGFVGSAVVKELISAGHQVLGLARSEAAAQWLADAGADIHRGALEDLDSLKKGAAAADGVIHTAFNHDFSRYKASCEEDRHIIEAMASVLAGSNRPLVITSGIGVVTPGRFATENDSPAVTSAIMPRVASEEAAEAVAAKGVHTSLVRLPPSVHGDGDHGFVPMLIDIARAKGVSAYVEEGKNRWPAIHRLDAAKVFRLALEKGAAWARYHAIGDDEGVPVRDIATIIGQRLHVPVVSMKKEEAAAHFGWIGHFVSLDVAASGTQTQQQLGWKPDGIGLIADLEQGTYFSK